jgi:hypothetical protein
MSKGGAKARHSARNWRFCESARGPRASIRDPRRTADITDLLGKLPRNVSDHKNPQQFPGEIDCTAVRTLARCRHHAALVRGFAAGRRNAQFPDTVSRETDGGPTSDGCGAPFRQPQLPVGPTPPRPA